MSGFHVKIRVEGSPPRVRSRLHIVVERLIEDRITSACAEQTTVIFSSSRGDWDHLRVCGADQNTSHSLSGIWGSPPRVRSRLTLGGGIITIVGITSACAEQTTSFFVLKVFDWDHLRVCGADPSSLPAVTPKGGSPPRVRSRPLGCWL